MRNLFICIFILLPSLCRPENVVETSSGQQDWKILVGTSSYQKDIDMDGYPEKFVFKVSLDPKNACFQNEMIIRRDAIKQKPPKILWDETVSMSYSQMYDLLGMENKITLSQWISRFFTDKVNFGAKIKKVVISEIYVYPELLEEYAKKHNMALEGLKQLVFDQKKKIMVTYPATSAEGITMIVYIPQLDDFVFISGDIG